MNEKDFVTLCKKTVAEYANEHIDKSDGKQDQQQYSRHQRNCQGCVDHIALCLGVPAHGLRHLCTHQAKADTDAQKGKAQHPANGTDNR